jgi:hypothetical protein
VTWCGNAKRHPEREQTKQSASPSMAIPGFRKRRAATSASSSSEGPKDSAAEGRLLLAKRLTKTRRNAIIAASCFYLLAFVFLVLVGCTQCRRTMPAGPC